MGGDFSDQLKNVIRYKRTGYNVHVMRQSACLCDRVHACWLTQSRLTTSLFNCTPAGRASDEMKATPKHVQYNWLGLDALSLVGPIGIQLLDICCSSVSVRVLLLSFNLVSTQCCGILIYMTAVLMHRRIRSPSRGLNTLYVF